MKDVDVIDVTSPEWDDLMKIDQKISELGFGENFTCDCLL